MEVNRISENNRFESEWVEIRVVLLEEWEDEEPAPVNTPMCNTSFPVSHEADPAAGYQLITPADEAMEENYIATIAIESDEEPEPDTPPFECPDCYLDLPMPGWPHDCPAGFLSEPHGL